MRAGCRIDPQAAKCLIGRQKDADVPGVLAAAWTRSRSRTEVRPSGARPGSAEGAQIRSVSRTEVRPSGAWFALLLTTAWCAGIAGCRDLSKLRPQVSLDFLQLEKAKRTAKTLLPRAERSVWTQAAVQAAMLALLPSLGGRQSPTVTGQEPSPGHTSWDQAIDARPGWLLDSTSPDNACNSMGHAWDRSSWSTELLQSERSPPESHGACTLASSRSDLGIGS